MPRLEARKNSLRKWKSSQEFLDWLKTLNRDKFEKEQYHMVATLDSLRKIEFSKRK